MLKLRIHQVIPLQTAVIPVSGHQSITIDPRQIKAKQTKASFLRLTGPSVVVNARRYNRIRLAGTTAFYHGGLLLHHRSNLHGARGECCYNKDGQSITRGTGAGSDDGYHSSNRFFKHLLTANFGSIQRCVLIICAPDHPEKAATSIHRMVVHAVIHIIKLWTVYRIHSMGMANTSIELYWKTVQVRIVPLTGSESPVTVTKAFAAQFNLPSSPAIRAVVTLTWPIGVTVKVSPVNLVSPTSASVLNIDASPSSAFQSKTYGLLDDFDGNAGNDLRNKRGHIIPSHSSKQRG